MRLNAVYNNFEMGFFVVGEIVRTVELTFDLIWSSARPIERKSLKI